MLGMPEITLSIAGVGPKPGAPWGTSTADACRWVRAQGVRAVTLDAMRPDCRARDLGRSARRDFGAMLRRTELEVSGIDLWIPPEHFTDPAHSDRAIEVVHETAALIAEICRLAGGRSRPAVHLTFPAAFTERTALGHDADRHGTVICDHTPRPLTDNASPHDLPSGIGVGIDPAACLLGGTTPDGMLHAHRDHTAALRLSDANTVGRCPVGIEGGRLDLTSYAAACFGLGLVWITGDLRGLPETEPSAKAATLGWQQATRLPGG